MQLSVVIVSWNTATTTLTCINKVKKYLKKLNPQIIIVDNHSTDSTLSLLRKVTDIKLIKNSANLGFSKANNQAVKVATGKYLLFLNSDIKLIDNSIKKMLDFIEKDPTIGAIGPQFLNPDGSSQASVFPPQTIGTAFNHFWLKKNTFLKYLPKSQKPSLVWSLSGGAFLIRKSLFLQLGGWDERYFMYFEDLELCRQIRKINKQIYFFPGCRLIHQHGASGKKLTDSQNQWRRLIKSSLIYHGFIKHYLINLIIWSSQKWFRLKKTFL